jgi:HAD superfamily hydrolase (TIGR01509 family)
MDHASVIPPGFGVIFDMDGLMLDTESIAKMCWERAFAATGRDMTGAMYASMIGRNKRDCVELLRAAFGDGFDFEATYAQCSGYYEEHVARHGTPLKPGVREVLGELSARGVPLAVATSTRGEKARVRLENAGLLRFFQTVVSGDEVAHGKPAPDIYLEAARRLGIDPARSFALEDSHAGVRAAHAAGLKVIMVPDLLPATAEIERLAHRVVSSLHEARALLNERPSAIPNRGGL